MLLRCRTLGINFQSTLIRRITTSSEEVSKKGEAKAFETIPSVPSIPIFGSIFNSDMKWGQFHHTVLQRTKKLGKIYMDKFFTAKLVVTSSPACAAAMFRAEGKYPTRMSVDMWKYPRQKLGVPLSVFLRYTLLRFFFQSFSPSCFLQRWRGLVPAP